jgi:hypothetical protein
MFNDVSDQDRSETKSSDVEVEVLKGRKELRKLAKREARVLETMSDLDSPIEFRF